MNYLILVVKLTTSKGVGSFLFPVLMEETVDSVLTELEANSPAKSSLHYYHENASRSQIIMFEDGSSVQVDISTEYVDFLTFNLVNAVPGMKGE